MTFKAGDIVRLKSGGPAMVVARLAPTDDSESPVPHCVWLTRDGWAAESPFLPVVLQLAVPAEVTERVPPAPPHPSTVRGSEFKRAAMPPIERDFSDPHGRPTVPVPPLCMRCIQAGIEVCMCDLERA